jgi:exodeoxyribonuclease V gamma subunit
VGPAHRLVAWVRLLAATAAHPERPLAAATVGRRRDGAPPWAKVTVARIPPLGADAGGRRERALAELGTLVDLHARGMREPLPIACQASAAYAQAAAGGWNGAAAALKAWRSDRDWDREDRHPEHVLVLGGVRSLDDLLAAKPAEDETGPGWDETETTRFGRCARRLWDPLLALEEVTDA